MRNHISLVEKYEGEDVVRVAIPDYMVADGCVKCHNTRADTPKNDWKLGDVRGSLEVITPITRQLDSIVNLNLVIIGSVILLGMFLLIMVYFIFGKVVMTPLNNLQDGLMQFFKYVNKESKEISPITISSIDEIGRMSSIINDNIQNSKELSMIENAFIIEVKDMLEKVENGYMNERFEKPIHSETLEELRQN